MKLLNFFNPDWVFLISLYAHHITQVTFQNELLNSACYQHLNSLYTFLIFFPNVMCFVFLFWDFGSSSQIAWCHFSSCWTIQKNHDNANWIAVIKPPFIIHFFSSSKCKSLKQFALSTSQGTSKLVSVTSSQSGVFLEIQVVTAHLLLFLLKRELFISLVRYFSILVNFSCFLLKSTPELISVRAPQIPVFLYECINFQACGFVYPWVGASHWSKIPKTRKRADLQARNFDLFSLRFL